MLPGAAPPVLATLTRDGVVESEHRGHLVVCDADGGLIAALGDPQRDTYVRSAAKPFQALAALAALAEAGVPLPAEAVAIACASHLGTDEQQIEAAHLLALAGLDEDALRCPPALPADPAAILEDPRPSRLAHNCSGKHAVFLLAQVAAGAPPERYLEPGSGVQAAVRASLAGICGATPNGPGTDGCGAPAWRLPLAALATGFARLAQARDPLVHRVRTAMTEHPDLVGGAGTGDTALMRADGRVVAKRGAEAVFAAGARSDRGPVGVAVKIADGGTRAAPPCGRWACRSPRRCAARSCWAAGGRTGGCGRARRSPRRCSAPEAHPRAGCFPELTKRLQQFNFRVVGASVEARRHDEHGSAGMDRRDATHAAADAVRDLGSFIREQRKAAQLSLRNLAQLADVSNPYLSQIERGLRNPSAEILQRVAEALRISAETLYVKAGILEERDDDLAARIAADGGLTEAQKRALLEVYLSFRQDRAETPDEILSAAADPAEADAPDADDA